MKSRKSLAAAAVVAEPAAVQNAVTRRLKLTIMTSHLGNVVRDGTRTIPTAENILKSPRGKRRSKDSSPRTSVSGHLEIGITAETRAPEDEVVVVAAS